MEKLPKPKHINHRFDLSNGSLEIIHFIASNKIAIQIHEDSTQFRPVVDVSRAELRAIRDQINLILGE